MLSYGKGETEERERKERSKLFWVLQKYVNQHVFLCY